MRKNICQRILGLPAVTLLLRNRFVCLVTNEGNADLVTALPKTQITVMGMERIVPTFEEMEVLVSLLTRSAVGQKLTSYITVLTGPREELDVDGPEEFHW